MLVILMATFTANTGTYRQLAPQAGHKAGMRLQSRPQLRLKAHDGVPKLLEQPPLPYAAVAAWCTPGTPPPAGWCSRVDHNRQPEHQHQRRQ